MKKIITIALLLCSLLTLGACGAKEAKAEGPFAGVGTAPDGNELAIEASTIKFINHMNEGGYQIISTEDIKAKIDAKEDMVIIDTMPADKFAKNHIPGALNAELPKEGVDKATDEQKEAFFALLGDNKDKTIIVYCGYVKCARSHVGAQLAIEAGYKNVYRQPGGIVAWSAAGYEMESSK